MLVVEGEGIPDTYEKIIRGIRKVGEMNTTEYGPQSVFVNGLTVEMTNPKEMTWHPKDPFCTKNKVEEYKKQFVRGFKHGFAYTYMDRLTKYPNVCNSQLGSIDQIELIARQLKSGRFESRRLQAITWIPEIDSKPENKEPPCFQRIWVYLRPNKTADFHVNFRSWDMFKAYEANMNALLWMIREEFLEPAGIKLNALRALSDNCHIYSTDLEAANKV